jgi:ubiquitin-like modifier-activating enzyme ATG7
MSVPMPGHPFDSKEEAEYEKTCAVLEDLISKHDVIFILTDTRESRWLPTLICKAQNKVAEKKKKNSEPKNRFVLMLRWDLTAIS